MAKATQSKRDICKETDEYTGRHGRGTEEQVTATGTDTHSSSWRIINLIICIDETFKPETRTTDQIRWRGLSMHAPNIYNRIFVSTLYLTTLYE